MCAWKKQYRKKDASTFFRCYKSTADNRYHCFYPQKGQRPCTDLDLSTSSSPNKKCDFRMVLDNKKGRRQRVEKYDQRKSSTVYNNAPFSKAKRHLNKARQRYATAISLLNKYGPFQIDARTHIEKWDLYGMPNAVKPGKARFDRQYQFERTPGSRGGGRESSKGMPKIVAFRRGSYEPVDKKYGVQKEDFITRPMNPGVSYFDFIGPGATKNQQMYGKARAYRRSAMKQLYWAMVAYLEDICQIAGTTMEVNQEKQVGPRKRIQPSDVLSEADRRALLWMKNKWTTLNPNDWFNRFKQMVLVLNQLIPTNGKVAPLLGDRGNLKKPTNWSQATSAASTFAGFLNACPREAPSDMTGGDEAFVEAFMAEFEGQPVDLPEEIADIYGGVVPASVVEQYTRGDVEGGEIDEDIVRIMESAGL